MKPVLRWGDGDPPAPNTHSDAGGVDAMLRAAAESGELVHYANLIVRNQVTGAVSPYAVCDAEADLFPDPGKYCVSGSLEAAKDKITCKRCLELGDWEREVHD